MVKINNFKAFTLIESLVSLLLISSVVAVCLLLFNNMGIKDHSKQDARILVDNYYNKLESGLISTDKTYFEEKELELNIQFKNYAELKHLLQVNVSVNRGKDVIYTSKKIVILNEN